MCSRAGTYARLAPSIFHRLNLQAPGVGKYRMQAQVWSRQLGPRLASRQCFGRSAVAPIAFQRQRGRAQEAWSTEAASVWGGIFGLFGMTAANFAICDASVPGDEAATVPEGLVLEPESKTLFPRVISEEEQLVSAGVRLMTPLKVQVYALGLYTDPKLASMALSRWLDADAGRLLADKSFWEALTSPESSLPRTFRMQVVREVSGKHMQQGFDRGLVPRVKYAARKEGLPGGKDNLRIFNAAFKNAGQLKEGQEILIRCLGHGKLRLEIEGRPPVELDSPALVHCFLDMFLGEKSVAPNVKECIAVGFESILRIN